MIRTEKGWKFESTGRQFYDYIGIIGIDKNLDITYGYDGSIEVKDENGEGEYDEGLDEIVRPEEKQELALHMIELWKKYGGIS